MFQIVTLDRWAESCVRPLTCDYGTEECYDGSGKIFFIRVFFMVFVVMSCLILLNTVFATIVETTFSLTRQDEEAAARDSLREKEKELQVLTDIFLDMDEDRSGDLNKREFMYALDTDEYVRQKLISLDMTPEFLRETWDLLDDGDGQLTVFEFTSGIRNLKGNTKTKEVLDTEKRLQYCKEFMDDILEKKIILLDKVMSIIQRD